MGACIYISLEFCKVFSAFKHTFLFKTQIILNIGDNDHYVRSHTKTKEMYNYKSLLSDINIMVIIGEFFYTLSEWVNDL